MNEALNKYVKKFRKLRVDRSHGVAPHKPILLLSIIQAYELSILIDEHIYISTELVALFKNNWSAFVSTNHDCKFAYPFFHLRSEGFWSLIPKPEYESTYQIQTSIKSLSSLDAVIDCALIDLDLFYLLKSPTTRSVLSQIIMETYFPNKSLSSIEISKGYEIEIQQIEHSLLNEEPSVYASQVKSMFKEHKEEEVFLRSSLFKRQVPKIYNNSCCITGLRVDSILNFSMVDACHIVPFSESFDCNITNGLALCPNMHRAFDRGIITIDNNYRVKVSTKFSDEDNSYGFRKFNGQQILLPSNSKYLPAIKNLEWHQKKVFRA